MTAARKTISLTETYPWLIPAVLFVAAVAVRLVYLFQIESLPTFYHAIMDEGYHLVVADQIRSGTLPAEPYYRAPLYPHVLGLLLTLTGSSLFWSRLIQIVMGAFLPLIMFGLGRRLFNRTVATWSAVVAVFYPTFLYYDATLLITSLMVLLTTLLTWQIYRTEMKPSALNCIAAGLLLGLAGLARPNILLLGPALIIWIIFSIRPTLGWKRAIGRYALIGLAAVVVVAPVTIRNYVAGNELVMIAWQGGFNFFLGNNRQASGWSATAPGIDGSWEGGYQQAIAIAEQARGRRLPRTEVSDYWYDVAFDEIRSAPGAFLALQVKKLRLFFNGYEIPNNQDIYLARDFAPVLKPLLFTGWIYFPYGLLAPLALLGLILSLRQWRRFLPVYLVLGSYIFSLMLFFVCARYRQPLLPLMILMAVYGVQETARFVRRRNYRAIALFAILLLGLTVESNHDMLRLDPNRVNAENHLMLGNAWRDQANANRAVNEYRTALSVDPTYALAHNNLGLLFAQRGNLRDAAGHFESAIRLDPQTIEPFYNLATVYLETGQATAAIGVLEKGRQVHPYDDYMELKLAMTYFEVGDMSQARQAVRRSLQLNRESQPARDLADRIRRTLDTTTTEP